jgi:hypothetical protein
MNDVNRSNGFRSTDNLHRLISTNLNNNNQQVNVVADDRQGK